MHKNIDLINEFITTKRPKYLFGTNKYAKMIAEKIDVDGFIDDLTIEKEFLTKPIKKIYEIPKNSIILSCVVLAKPKFALKKIISHGFDAIDYFSFVKHSKLGLENVLFNANQNFIKEHRENSRYYKKLHSRLEDKKSKETLNDIIQFRLSLDMSYLSGYEYQPQKQYFEDFIHFGPNEVFLDVGGFDGFTSKLFMEKCPDYKEIHVLEPDKKNLITIKDNLSKYEKVVIHDFGLSDSESDVRFNSLGPSSRISNKGESGIKVKPLDSIHFKNKITFVKMDIEGAESNAIKGATDTIKRFHPAIAVSVYHKVDDFRVIPNLILGIRDDYKLFLRHYTEGVIETVMYFVPN